MSSSSTSLSATTAAASAASSYAHLNAQIQLLSAKNIQAEHQLKQLQRGLGDNATTLLTAAIGTTNVDANDQRDALAKLKREQRLLKEQINALNKERESTQLELDVITTSSVSLTKGPHHSRTTAGAAATQRTTTSDDGRENDDDTPSLSPIGNDHFLDV